MSVFGSEVFVLAGLTNPHNTDYLLDLENNFQLMLDQQEIQGIVQILLVQYLEPAEHHTVSTKTDFPLADKALCGKTQIFWDTQCQNSHSYEIIYKLIVLSFNL